MGQVVDMAGESKDDTPHPDTSINMSVIYTRRVPRPMASSPIYASSSF